MSEANNNRKSVIVSVSMPTQMVDAADSLAERGSTSRAAIVREAVARYLRHEGLASAEDAKAWRMAMLRKDGNPRLRSRLLTTKED